MRAHLLLMLSVVNLLIGTWAIVSTANLARLYGSVLLRRLNQHTIAFNTGLILLILLFYKNLNLSEQDLAPALPVLTRITEMVASLCELIMIDALIRLQHLLTGRRLRPWYNRLAAGFIVLLLISYALLLFPLPQDLLHPLARCQGLLFDNVLMAELIPLFVLLAMSRKISNRTQRHMARGLAWLYLGRYGLLLLGLPLATLPRDLRHVVAATLFISLNLMPMIWIRYFFSAPPRPDLSSRQQALDTLVQKYHISKREREILELILEGRSNKQIESELFISYHTVKNHVYNLFQKLGVTNRYELMNLVEAARQTPSID